MPAETDQAATRPIVYTIRGCDSCVKLLQKFEADGLDFEERRVELSQVTLEEARRYGSLVPIVVWPDGRVEHAVLQPQRSHLGGR